MKSKPPEQIGYNSNDEKGIMQMQNRGTLDYPEVNWTMITEGPNMRGGLIPNPDYIPYEHILKTKNPQKKLTKVHIQKKRKQKKIF